MKGDGLPTAVDIAPGWCGASAAQQVQEPIMPIFRLVLSRPILWLVSSLVWTVPTS